MFWCIECLFIIWRGMWIPSCFVTVTTKYLNTKFKHFPDSLTKSTHVNGSLIISMITNICIKLIVLCKLKFVHKYFIISVRSVPFFRHKILFQLVEYLYCCITIIYCNLLVKCWMIVTNKSCIISVVSWLVCKELLKERSPAQWLYFIQIILNVLT